MRLLHVSAHYPPNFVSGGTLVPQRLARALKERGHDVGVYAGFLDEARSPLSAWNDVDDTGLPVRWIVSTPWIGWGDDHNYDNPAVAADFARHLATVRPEIVHVHAVQSLGAGVIDAAASAGARVVVTMHDFWWYCARQFLVDRSYQPCSLVVDAGVCQCEVGRPWLDRRTASLRRALGNAEVILAPSRSARAVLIANGLPGERVRVDENGLPPAQTAHTRLGALSGAGEDGAGRVRFLYAGGSNRMKGVQVLFEATRLLAGQAGWALSAYGAQDFLDRTAADVTALPVRALPPYLPDQLDEVLAQHDVLVVPSVMRESHSILTREALRAGLAVVCTDTLGPEEVVAHERNGLIVAAAHAHDLADAMGRLADDRAFLAALRAAPHEVSIRPLDDQVDGLERLYRELADGPRGATVGGPDPVRQVLFICGIEGAPLRYRARLPAEALATRGVDNWVRHYRDPELPELANRADAIVLYRVPATVQILDLVARIHARPTPVPVLFDVDDLIVDPDLEHEIPAIKVLPPDEAALWMQGVRRYRTTLEACDMFVGSTQELCRHVSALTGLPARRFPNGVGTVMGRLADIAVRRPRAPGPVRIGYLSGTTTHDRDWWEVEPAVVEVLRAHPDVELWIGGHLNPSPVLHPVRDRVRRLPLLPWHELPGVLRDLDVNLAPLEPIGRFNEAKSAIKWLEAALAGTPTVASPSEPFREAVTPGLNGLLAASHEEWVAALDLLVTQAATRHRLGNRARRDALLRWSPHLQGERYHAILTEARALVSAPGRAPRGSAGSAWEPVALDEPYLTSVLEPYAFPGSPAGRSGSAGDDEATHGLAARPGLPTPPVAVVRAREVAHRYWARAALLWREQGVAGIAEGAGRTLRRLGRRARAAGARARRGRGGSDD